jgi:hypothetical protein
MDAKVARGVVVAVSVVGLALGVAGVPHAANAQQECGRWFADRASGTVMVYDSARQELLAVDSENLWVYNGSRWIRRAESRGVSLMAYDSNREVVVGVGRDGTFEWDGAEWTRRDVPTTPVAGDAMVHDSRRGLTYVMTTTNGNLWEYDGTAWTLRELQGPPSRQEAAYAFDRERGVVVRVGGEVVLSNTCTNDLRDAWTFDGTSWTRIADLPFQLCGRGHHGAFFDPTRGGVVITGTVFTYKWNGSGWDLVGEVLQSAPKPAAFDERLGRPIVGVGETRELGTDGRWTVRSTNDPGPIARTRGSYAMTYDSQRAKAVFIQGVQYLWELGTTGWSLSPIALPSGMSGSMMSLAYDPIRGRTVVSDPNSSPFLSRPRTFLYNGVNWTQPNTQAFSSDRKGSLAFDPVRGTMVLSSPSTFSSVWELRGENSDEWQRVQNTGDIPFGREAHASVFDPRRGALLIHGGTLVGSFLQSDMWELRGSTWTRIPAEQVGALAYHTMIFDPARGVVTVSPSTGSTRTWKFDGTAWTDLGIEGLPDLGIERYYAMVFHEALGVPVLFANSTTYYLRSEPPRVVTPPEDEFACPRLGARLRVEAAGNSTLRYQWRKDGLPLADDGRIRGSRTPLLRVLSPRDADEGSYDVVITNACGTTTSPAAMLTVSCAADFDCSLSVDFNDYLDFVSAFDLDSPNADFDGNGNVDFFDYLDFVAAFAACQ